MATGKHALIRYRIIDKCLRDKYNPFPSMERIRAKCADVLLGIEDSQAISLSTIEKDFNAMRFDESLGFFAPIKFSRANNGYYYQNPDYTISSIPLNADDLEALRNASLLMEQYKEVQLFEQFGFALSKIFEKIRHYDTVEDAENRAIQFEGGGMNRGHEYLTTLLQYIKEKRWITILYKKFEHATAKPYHLAPYFLKEYHKRWYLLARDASDNKVKTFSLDRLLSLEASKSFFETSDGFEPESFLKYAYGITATEAKPESVVLKITGNSIPYVRSQPLHTTQEILQESENEMIVCLKVYVTYELTSAILGLGEGVELLEPIHYRNEIALKIQNIAKKYQE